MAFAGGGARGLVHVGALKALSDQQIQIAGVAGTSAGAIVAALCAVGVTADEMVDPQTGKTLFEQLRDINHRFHSATAIFGPGGWGRISFLYQLVRDLTPLKAAVGVLLVVATVLAPAAGHQFEGGWGVTALAALAVAALMGALGIGLLRGLARLSDFVDCLNTLLQRRLFPGEPERVVTFEDLRGSDLPTLKVVASEISSGELRLFSPQSTPSVPVAQAVAASICLPFVFRPMQIGDHTYVDGGLVSNLPAWPFDEERELDPAALTLAFDIAPDRRKRKINWANWPVAALGTALSGAAVLNLRAMRNAHLFVLETELDLLAFDLRPMEVAHQVQQATTAAAVVIARKVSVEPDIYRAACEAAHRMVVSACYGAPQVFESRQPPLRVRVGLAMRDAPDSLSARLRFGAGFEADDVDRGILMPMVGSVTGAAWREGRMWLERAPFNDDLNLPGPDYAYMRRRTWPELAWILCVPIFRSKANEPSLVVTVDSSRPLKANRAADAFARKLGEELNTLFKSVLIELDS